MIVVIVMNRCMILPDHCIKAVGGVNPYIVILYWKQLDTRKHLDWQLVSQARDECNGWSMLRSMDDDIEQMTSDGTEDGSLSWHCCICHVIRGL